MKERESESDEEKKTIFEINLFLSTLPYLAGCGTAAAARLALECDERSEGRARSIVKE